MNHIYRLVWSRVAQAWVAVAETTAGRRGGRGRQRARRVGALALALPAAACGLPAAAQTVVLAPGQQAGAYVAPNGATVVDIANPNAAGVSHNRFLRYDVDAKGLVLNNTTVQGPMVNASQLAGAVLANPNATRAAGIIVNEMAGTSRSTLAGFTEVAGQRADVVVANPYGITCSGCGFINTDRVTLATGQPRWGADGSLQGFDNLRGDILVNGTGMNATGQQILDLVTRSVRLDGAVSAQDLGVYTGTGSWDYASRTAAAGAAASGAPAYAIDSSVLGGMYANSIRLVATEAGVGVRMLGDAAASRADFTLSAAGQVQLSNRVSAQRDVQVAAHGAGAGAIVLSGASLTAGRDLGAVADAGALQASSSTLVAGASMNVAGQGGVTLAQAQLGAGQNAVLTANGGALSATGGTLVAGGNVNATARQASVGGGAQWNAGQALQVAASAGDLALGAAGLQASGAVTLSASGNLNVGAGTQQGVRSRTGSVILRAGGGVSNGGAVSADAAGLVVQAGSGVNNTGTLNARGDLQLTAATLGNTGSILAGRQLALQAGTITNAGALQGATATVGAQTVANTGRLLATQGAATLQVAQSLANSGTVQAGTTLALHGAAGGAAPGVTNQGRLVAGGALALDVGALSNQAGAVLQGQTGGTVNAASLANAGTLLLNRQTGSAATLAVAGDMANSGLLQARDSLALSAQTLRNAGTLLAQGDAQLHVAALDNQAGATLVSDGALALHTGTLGNAANARIQSGVAGTVVVTGQTSNAGAVVLATRSGGTASFDMGTQGSNTGQVQAAGNLNLAATALTNSGSIDAGGDLAGNVGSFDNSGQLDAGGALQLTAQTFGNTGAVAAGGQATLDATTSGSNAATGTVRGAGGLALNFGAGGFQNAGLLQAGVGAAGELATLRVAGGSGALANTGQVQGGTLDLTVASLANSGGITGGAGGSTITAATGEVRNQAGGTMSLGAPGSGASQVNASGIGNDGTLQSQDGLQLNVGTGGLASTGQLLTGGDLAIAPLAGNSYTASLAGTVAAGGLLSVQGDAASQLQLQNTAQLQNAAQVQAGAIDIATGTLALGSRTVLAAKGSANLDVQDLTLGQDVTGSPATVHTARILGATGGTAGSSMAVTVGHDFTDDGLLFSGTDLTVAAPNVHVTPNGALSALGNLTVNATGGQLDLSAASPAPNAGNLQNEGLLYAGQALHARVNGTLTNDDSIAAGSAIDLVANTVVNHRDIDSQGDLRVVAAQMRNEVTGGDTRVITSTWNPANVAWSPNGSQWNDGGAGGNLDKAQNYVAFYTETLAFPTGQEPTYWPRLTAQRDMQLYFHTGSNLGGLLQGVNSVLLQGFDAQAGGTPLAAGVVDDLGQAPVAPTTGTLPTFTNNSLAQVVTSHEVLYTQERKEAGPAGGAVISNWHWCSPGDDPICYRNINGNQGYPVQTDLVTGVTPINPVGYSGARIYTANLSGGGFAFFNEGSTTPASFDPGTVQSTQLLSLGGVSAPGPGPAQSSVLPGAGTQTGWTPVPPGIQSITVAGSNGLALQTGLAFGGIQLTLPVGPNGLFVTTTDPAAGYLVESNPLYQVGSSVAGSDYLRQRLGLDPDSLQLRLGDDSYEAWLVQQQLLAQTGSLLLKGYGSLDAQMKGLWDNAAQAAKALGLVWGTALTPAQQAALRQDLVWMVRTEVNGRPVLVPVVYLSQATKDGIRKGAIVSADQGTLKVQGLANSGTIETSVQNQSGGGKGGAVVPSALGIPLQFRDQTFQIVKDYLLSLSPDHSVAYGDVNAWLDKNKSDPQAMGKVLPYAFQRFMSLASGKGVMSDSDKAFVAYVGGYAKAQRLQAIDDALQAYSDWKQGAHMGQEGKHALLTSLFDLGESPPDSIMNLAKSGISWNDNAEASRIGAILGSSVGAGAGAGGASAALMNQIFPYLGRALASTGSSITGASVAAGPAAIVAAAAAIAGQAIAKVVKDASFEKDLLKLKAQYESVPDGDVGYWLQQKGGPEQFLVSMAKMMAD